MREASGDVTEESRGTVRVKRWPIFRGVKETTGLLHTETVFVVGEDHHLRFNLVSTTLSCDSKIAIRWPCHSR
jgi:hypothetical protein